MSFPSHNKILLSIIIPVYNAEKWLKNCLESILNQEPSNEVEIIVIDDGSTDNSLNILRSYRDNCKIISQRNNGVSNARNTGAKAAKGKYLKFLDADDELPTGSLYQILKYVNKNTDGILIGRSNTIDQEGKLLNLDLYNLKFIQNNESPFPVEYLFAQPISSSLWLIPRYIFLKSGGFPECISLGEEYLFTINLIKTKSQFFCFNSNIANIRIHNGPRLTKISPESAWLTQLACIMECVNYLFNRNQYFDKNVLDCISDFCLANGRHCFRSNFNIAGDAYFNYYKTLCSPNKRLPYSPYKLLTLLMGPRLSEVFISKIKSF